MPPATFGHYRVDTRIGHGGMGEVYRAFDTKLNRFVAVKVMRSLEAADVAVVPFRSRRKTMSRVRHLASNPDTEDRRSRGAAAAAPCHRS